MQPKHIVDFARSLHRGGRSPSTVQNYLSHLSAALSMGRTAWGYDLDRNVVTDGVAAARHLDLTGKSNSRDRRPTLQEIDALMTHFAEASARDSRTLPMHRIMAYAIFSVRRQHKITRITWEDFDEAQMRQMVRDMKHPGQKKGNDILCEVMPEALRVMQLQPGRSGTIFPYNSDTISTRFTRACKFLEIDDLHVHDLRHERVSRLFEMGRTIKPWDQTPRMIAPLSISLPARRIFSPAAGRLWNLTVSPTRATSSCIATASAPSATTGLKLSLPAPYSLQP